MSSPWLRWPLSQKTDITRRLEDTDFEHVGAAAGELHPPARKQGLWHLKWREGGRDTLFLPWLAKETDLTGTLLEIVDLLNFKTVVVGPVEIVVIFCS